MRVQRILYPTDFSSCAKQALSHAIFLAEQFDAELHMLHAVVLHTDDPHHPNSQFAEPEEIFQRVDEIAHSSMAKLVEEQKGKLLKVQQVRRRGVFASSVILDYAKEKDIDLIVMGTHGHHGAAHFLLGSVAERTVRLAPCPVLTLRETTEPRVISALQRMLVPVDFSGHSKQALIYAKSLAAIYGASLQLVYVLEERPSPPFYTEETLPEGPLIKRAEQALSEMSEVIDGNVPFECHVITGRPATEIIRFAEEKSCDLIVVATHGLSGLEHLLLGSTTEQIVRYANAPVFTVKCFGKSLLETDSSG